ncbi:hypothetical protein GCM10023347_07350 [Streptomyces chumphonensis]
MRLSERYADHLAEFRNEVSRQIAHQVHRNYVFPARAEVDRSFSGAGSGWWAAGRRRRLC